MRPAILPQGSLFDSVRRRVLFIHPIWGSRDVLSSLKAADRAKKIDGSGGAGPLVEEARPSASAKAIAPPCASMATTYSY
jgi:hypothetical protein